MANLQSHRQSKLLSRSLRISSFPYLSSALVGIWVLVILDIFLPFAKALLLAFVVLMVLIFLVSVVSGGRLAEPMNRLALLTVSVAIGIAVSDFLFRWLLLKPIVPTSEEQFIKYIASEWPRFITPEKDPNTFRILGVADSFGVAGDTTNYHYLLEALFRREGLRMEVVNISVGGIQLPDKLKLIKHFGARYHPDLVLVGFFVGNSFWVPKGELKIYRGISVEVPKGIASLRPRNLPLLRWLRRYIRALADQRFLEAERAQQKPTGSFSKRRFLRIKRRILRDFRREPDPRVRWEKVTAILDKIRKEVDQMGARYVMVIHPDELQVDEELRRQLGKAYPFLDFSRYDFELPQHFLRDYCISRGIWCIDLLPHFRGTSSPGKDLYEFRDTHYNREGNARAAGAIFDFLNEKQRLS